jgi:magnesium transporter
MAGPDTMIGDIEDRPPVYIEATMPGEDVVAEFERYDRVALPVVDKDRTMLGIITADDVLDFAQKRATEEMQKLGGSAALDAPYRETGLLLLARKRGVWLAVLFLGQTMTASVIGYWQGAIDALPMLAMFMPLVISSGGNSGSQTTSIIIRSLALQELRLRDVFYVMRRELLSGLALGASLGLIGFLCVAAWYWLGLKDFAGHPYRLALAVWGSLIGVVTLGSVVGAMLPFVLRKLKLDPATASAPFVATLVDVTGLLIYFGTAWVFLHNLMSKL